MDGELFKVKRRAHYFDFVGDKTVVAVGEGNFIFDTKNFRSKNWIKKITV